VDSAGGDERERVVVPWAPGRVARVPGAAPSDVDVVLDELFGPADTGGPGWFDVVLVVAAVVLVLRGFVPLGVVALVLGLALPVRSLARRVRRGVRRRRYRSLLALGQPLVTGDAATDALLAAYDALLAVVPAAAPWLGEPAVEAAHRAVVECASLLAGRAPSTPEERAYVARRTSAIREVTAALPAGSPDPERVAAVRAREEVDAVSGPTSVDDLRALAARAGRTP
jgi:hypothetical protein